MKAYIYTLQCDKTGHVYYVGASKNLEIRMYQHQTQRATSNNAFYTWWRKSEIQLKLEVLEEVEYTERFSLHLLETFWIEQLRTWGFDLKNQVKNISARKLIKGNRNSGAVHVSLGASYKNRLRDNAEKFDRTIPNYAKLIIKEYLDGKLVYTAGDGPLLR